MNPYLHADDVDWKKCEPFPDDPGSRFEFKEFPNIKDGPDSGWTFHLARLPRGGALPLHTHTSDLMIYILSGEARVRLGAQSIELEERCTAYLPARLPHSIETVGEEPVVYTCAYHHFEGERDIDWSPAEESVADQLRIFNHGPTCWALHEEFAPWEYWEPSKGTRLRYRTLFAPEKQEVRQRAIVYSVGPNTHYSLHFHSDPQLYYVLSGRAVMYVGEGEYELTPGACLFVGANVIHGIDNFEDEPVKTWVVKIPGSVENWQKTMVQWTPVENIYTKPRRKTDK